MSTVQPMGSGLPWLPHTQAQPMGSQQPMGSALPIGPPPLMGAPQPMSCPQPVGSSQTRTPLAATYGVTVAQSA